MFSIKTRSRNLDYSMDAFDPSFSTEWLRKYRNSESKLNYIRDDSKVDIYLEVNDKKWFLYFGKIPTERKSSAGQSIYTSIIGEGSVSDKKSKNQVIKLLVNAFFDDSPENSINNQIAPVFEKHFTEETINGFDGKRDDTQTSKLINEKIISFINELPDSQNTKVLEDEKLTKWNIKDLEFNKYAGKEKILPFIYALLFSKDTSVKKIFACTSTKLNQEKIEELKKYQTDNIVDKIMTLDKDTSKVLPQTIKSKSYRINMKTKVQGKKTAPEIIKNLMLFIIIVLIGYSLVCWNFVLYPFKKNILEEKAIYSSWIQFNERGKKIAYINKTQKCTEIFIDDDLSEKALNMKITENNTNMLIKLQESSDEKLDKSNNAITVYELIPDEKSKKIIQRYQRTINLFGKEYLIGKPWSKEK